MTGWVILVDQARDFPNADTPHKVITTRDYLARPKLFAGLGRAKIINLSRSYNYQSKGYYASLLAEARGHRVIPTVETMLDLRELKLYEQSLPELQEALTAGGAQGARDRGHHVRPPVLLRLRPGSPLRGVRPAPVRLVPVPGDRSHHHGGQAVENRPAARPAARQARAGRGGILPQEPASPHPARLAQPARPGDRPLFARRAARSAGGPAAVLARHAQAFLSGSPRSSRSRSSSSPGSSSRNWPNSTACSSARRPRSTATPTASPSAPAARACRSSTTRNR